MSSTVCGAPNLDGHSVTCTQPPAHRGPHAAPGNEPGVITVAWCTPPTPCRGRLCGGPCHPNEPNWEQT